MNCRLSRRCLNHPGAANNTRTPRIAATHAAATSSLFFMSHLQGRYKHHPPPFRCCVIFRGICVRQSLGLSNRPFLDAIYCVRNEEMSQTHTKGKLMRRFLLATFFAACLAASPLSAQLPAEKKDPLARLQQATAACSATEASCAEAAAKIFPQVMGPSP